MFNITLDALRRLTTLEQNKLTLETTLLASSPSNGTDIRRANEELLKIVRKATNLLSLAKRYICRLTLMLKKSNSKRTLL